MHYTKPEHRFYDMGYWFEAGRHTDCDDFGAGYYANAIFANLVAHLPDIPSGKIVVLGTNRCVSFGVLCAHFGIERCVGYDLHNPTKHTAVRVMDCMTLCPDDRLDIAFCHNDIGSYPTTPRLKLHCQKWASANVVPGGYMLGRNNRNQAGVDLEGYMAAQGYENLQLRDLCDQYDLQHLAPSVLDGHMLSRRVCNV